LATVLRSALGFCSLNSIFLVLPHLYHAAGISLLPTQKLYLSLLQASDLERSRAGKPVFLGPWSAEYPSGLPPHVAALLYSSLRNVKEDRRLHTVHPASQQCGASPRWKPFQVSGNPIR
jgi:hypothetical protein